MSHVTVTPCAPKTAVVMKNSYYFTKLYKNIETFEAKLSLRPNPIIDTFGTTGFIRSQCIKSRSFVLLDSLLDVLINSHPWAY